MSGRGFASAEAKPLLPKAHCMGKIKIPKSKKIAIGQAIRSRWHFSLRFDIPQTERHQHHQVRLARQIPRRHPQQRQLLRFLRIQAQEVRHRRNRIGRITRACSTSATCFAIFASIV